MRLSLTGDKQVQACIVYIFQIQMGETRKSSGVPSESSGGENSSTTLLEKPAR